MASWNYSKTDPNPPHLTNLDAGNGEYSDSGRDPGIPFFPDMVIGFGCLILVVIVLLVALAIPLVLIWKG